MKVLLIICFLIMSWGSVQGAEAPAEFRQAFAHHQEKGTVFYYQTPKEFEAKGWGTFYRDAVAEQFKGTPVEGLRLETDLAEGYKAVTGDKITLSFHLYNESNRDIAVTVGGNCNTVHQAIYMLIDPQGKLSQSLGRIRVGGLHGYCKQNVETLPARSAIQLDTRTDSDVVVGFAPAQAGKYVIIGIYKMRTKEDPDRRVLSQPLVLNIVEKPAG
jgi:hypothetical protein